MKNTENILKCLSLVHKAVTCNDKEMLKKNYEELNSLIVDTLDYDFNCECYLDDEEEDEEELVM